MRRGGRGIIWIIISSIRAPNIRVVTREPQMRVRVGVDIRARVRVRVRVRVNQAQIGCCGPCGQYFVSDYMI